MHYTRENRIYNLYVGKQLYGSRPTKHMLKLNGLAFFTFSTVARGRVFLCRDVIFMGRWFFALLNLRNNKNTGPVQLNWPKLINMYGKYNQNKIQSRLYFCIEWKMVSINGLQSCIISQNVWLNELESIVKPHVRGLTVHNDFLGQQNSWETAAGYPLWSVILV